VSPFPAGAGSRHLGASPVYFVTGPGRTCEPPCEPFSSRRLASSTMRLKWSSSNQHSLVVRHSSCTSDVTTNGSRLGPRLRGPARAPSAAGPRYRDPPPSAHPCRVGCMHSRHGALPAGLRLDSARGLPGLAPNVVCAIEPPVMSQLHQLHACVAAAPCALCAPPATARVLLHARRHPPQAVGRARTPGVPAAQHAALAVHGWAWHAPSAPPGDRHAARPGPAAAACVPRTATPRQHPPCRHARGALPAAGVRKFRQRLSPMRNGMHAGRARAGGASGAAVPAARACPGTPGSSSASPASRARCAPGAAVLVSLPAQARCRQERCRRERGARGRSIVRGAARGRRRA